MAEKLKKFYVKTYGCQMNVYDSMVIGNIMKQEGYEMCDSLAEADLIVVNTCHIRKKATEKVYSELGRIKMVKKFGAIIVLAGCVAQAEGELVFTRMPFVDFVVGPRNIHQIPSLIKAKDNNMALDFSVDPKFDYIEQDAIPSTISAFLAIQEGCDKFCSFCVVPYTRGSEYSRPVMDVYMEAVSLARHGASEIILLGQNVNAYHGLDENGEAQSLGWLISKIARIKEIKRIRYVTSHPVDMHSELYDAHRNESKLMPFLHLPVQSGSDAVLKHMNRRYNYDTYMQVIYKLCECNPDIKFSSDIIVGFPGESDIDFAMTMKLVECVDFIQCFSFKYSPRPGTPGADFDNQVPEHIKDERLKILQKVLNDKQIAFNNKMIGRSLDILCLSNDAKNQNCMLGKTPYFQTTRIINANNKNCRLGDVVKVSVTKAYQNSLDAIIHGV
ncbi:tRNA (N6-isopentenyl adenosine(37)-C2)-methylthiotransferase MiaB [Candidatus Xenohaliotis californiensis]